MSFSIRYPDLSLLLHFTPVKQRGNSSSTKESLRWKSTLPLDRIDILYVYGLERKYAEVLQEWLSEKSNRHLVFLEDDLAALKTFSKMSKMIEHPQVHLRY